MSLIDTVFGGIPAPILADWGQDLTYVRAGVESYNTETGQITSTETTTTVRGVITQATPEEFEGFYQTDDIKIIIGAAELGDYYPSIRDRIRYNQAGTTKEARIIRVQLLRGDKPVLHTLLVRPQ
jgi:hypothetical protein